MTPYRSESPPPIQSLVEFDDEHLGLKYVKIVKSAIGPYHILDVMFITGLRLTVDMYDGDSEKKVQTELVQKIDMYRPTLSNEVLNEAVSILSDCAKRFLVQDGKVKDVATNAHLMKTLWDESVLSRRLNSLPKRECVDYDRAVLILKEMYGLP